VPVGCKHADCTRHQCGDIGALCGRRREESGGGGGGRSREEEERCQINYPQERGIATPQERGLSVTL